jgi:TonB family protein
MAPRLRASESPSEYSHRERKAIVLLTLAFIVLSTLAHFVLGALYPAFPKPHAAGPVPEQTLLIDVQAPTPTPLPLRPTPTPPPEHVALAPQAAQTGKPVSRPIAKPPTLRRSGGTVPTAGDDTPGSPGPIAPESPVPSTPPEPTASFAPCRMTRKIQPDYPEWAKSAGIQGTAIVILSLGPDGEVLSAHIGESSGNAALDQAALAAARASAYACPAGTSGGGPDLYQVIYTFRLDS